MNPTGAMPEKEDAMSEENPNPETPQEPETPEQPEPESSATDEPLGDGGKKALEAERAARKAAEKDAKRAKELEAELEQLREQQLSDQEKAIEKAKKETAKETKAEVQAEANKRLFKAEVRAAAAGKIADPDLLNDPDVALRLLEFEDVPVTDGGDVDGEAISSALDQLVERKPYLAVGDRQPVPDADQGTRGNGGKSQLTRDQLKNMTPAEIVQADTEGRLDKVKGRL